MRVLCVMVLVMWGAGACAQDQPAAVTAACRSVETVVVPKADPVWLGRVHPESSCDPDGLYYGTKEAPDYGAARGCALAEWQRLERPLNDIANPDVVMPIATLAMIYANGDGVPRNVDMAIRIVCVDDPAATSWQPLDQLIEALVGLKADGRKRFDFCNAKADFGRSVDYECGFIGYAIEEKQHMVPLSRTMARWTTEQRAAYARMMKARDAFVGKETDAEAISGTGVGGSMMDTTHRLRLELIDSMVKLEAGTLPSFTHQEYLAADMALNADYAKLMKDMAVRYDGGCCTKPPETIRDAERAWIGYRDAWVEFARVRWPQVTADSWMTWLTRERDGQLGSADDYDD